MPFIHTPPEREATGVAAELYAKDIADHGYVSNDTRVFALRPDVLDAWLDLAGAIRGGMDERRFELVTLAAARVLRSTYCAMAHGRVLRDRFHDAETVRRIGADHTRAGLAPIDVAIMDFAEQVVRDASSVRQEDVERLRGLGLTDREILDVILAAAARCFFSKVLDATGALADLELSQDLEPTLRAVLTVGRPAESSAPAREGA